MRKIAVLLVLILMVASCANTSPDGNRPDQPSGYSPIQIGQGPVCKPYEPPGDLYYEAEWTGEYPPIESFDGDYMTATFGMG